MHKGTLFQFTNKVIGLLRHCRSHRRHSGGGRFCKASQPWLFIAIVQCLCVS